MLYQLSHVRVLETLWFPDSRPDYTLTESASTGRSRADDGIRTRDPHLGKVMLYQLSYVRAASVRGLAPGGCPPRSLRLEL